MTRVRATTGPPNAQREEEIQYGDLSVIGNGSFGVVFKTSLIDSAGSYKVALKKVLQDRRYKVSLVYAQPVPPNCLLTLLLTLDPPPPLQNRELEIMRIVHHRNIVDLKWFFFSPGQKVRKAFFCWKSRSGNFSSAVNGHS